MPCSPQRGLIFYDPDYLDEYRRVATYLDRVLKGEKPADLPVQVPSKYWLSDLRHGSYRILSMPFSAFKRNVGHLCKLAVVSSL
jgi:hypothetical protein